MRVSPLSVQGRSIKLTSLRLAAVQWFRQRFNECFDKADFAKSRCQDDIPESATFAEKLVYDRALEIVSRLQCRA